MVSAINPCHPSAIVFFTFSENTILAPDNRFLLFQLIRKVFDLILKLPDLVLLLFQQGKSITAYLPIIASHTINKLNLIVASITRRKVNH